MSQNEIISWLEDHPKECFCSAELIDILGLDKRNAYNGLQCLIKSDFVGFKVGLFRGRPVKFYFFKKNKVFKEVVEEVDGVLFFVKVEDALNKVFIELERVGFLLKSCSRRKGFVGYSRRDKVLALKEKIKSEVRKW